MPAPPLPQPTPKIAFLDFDGTLMRGMSAIHSGFYLMLRGRLSPLWVLSSLFHLAKYRLQRANYEDILRDGLAPWIGQSRAELERVAAECFEGAVRHRIFAEALALLEQYRQAGTQLALLSSTTPFLLREAQRFLHCHAALATEFAFVEGGLSEEQVGVMVFGEGKVQKAAEYAAAQGASLADCAFYTDSASDLAMLEAVGHPVAVNPDLWLRRLATERGWPILLFKKTIGREHSIG